MVAMASKGTAAVTLPTNTQILVVLRLGRGREIVVGSSVARGVRWLAPW